MELHQNTMPLHPAGMVQVPIGVFHVPFVQDAVAEPVAPEGAVAERVAEPPEAVEGKEAEQPLPQVSV